MRVKLNGFNMAYEKWGVGMNVLVLIHGNLASKRWWDEVKHELAAEFTVYTMDLRGCGESDTPAEGYSIPQYVEDVNAFVEQMGIARFSLLGHSMGGAIAMGVARQLPEQVEKLILLNTAPVSGLQTTPEKMDMIRQYASDRKLLELALSAVVPLAVQKPLFPLLVEDAWRAAHTAVPNALSLAEFDLRAWAAGFRKPVLVLYGEKDALISREDTEKTRDAFPHSLLLTHPDSGHSPQVEVPEWFIAQVRNFMHNGKAHGHTT